MTIEKLGRFLKADDRQRQPKKKAANATKIAPRGVAPAPRQSLASASKKPPAAPVRPRASAKVVKKASRDGDLLKAKLTGGPVAIKKLTLA